MTIVARWRSVCRNAMFYAAFAASSVGNIAGATPLSLFLGNSVTVNGVNFTFNSYDGDASKIDVSFLGGNGFVGLNMRPIDIASNPWSSVGFQERFTNRVGYSISTTGGLSIDAALISLTYDARITPGQWYEIHTELWGLSDNIFLGPKIICSPLGNDPPCDYIPPHATLIAGTNFPGVQSADVQFYISGSNHWPYEVGDTIDSMIFTNAQNVFLLSPLTIQSINSPYAVLSDGQVLYFPVSEPGILELSTVALGLLGLVLRRRRQMHYLGSNH